MSGALALSMAVGAAPVAMAVDTTVAQSVVNEASAELARLNQNAELTTYDLISATVALGQTEELIAKLDAQIPDIESKLAAAKERLARFVAEDYKSGHISLLDIIFKSGSIEEFVSRIIYANHIVDYQRQAIDEVSTLYTLLVTQRASLVQAKADQERYIAEQQASLKAANEATLAAQSFYEQLPTEVREEIVQQQEAERVEMEAASREALTELVTTQIAEQIVEQAGDTGMSKEQIAAAIVDGTISEHTELLNEQTSQLVSGVSEAISADTTAEFASAVSETLSTSTSYSGSDMISRALELLGSGYQASGYNWTGSTSDSSFTCSGVVDYALGRDSQSSSPESLYEETGAGAADVSSLSAGDLVFYSYGDRAVGHVGIYLGDGQVLDSIPNGGVAIRDVNYMDVVGAGSLSSGSSSSSSDSTSSSSYDSSYDSGDSSSYDSSSTYDSTSESYA